MDKEMTIKEWQAKFEAGEFVPYNPYSTRAGYWSDIGWYVWFAIFLDGTCVPLRWGTVEKE